MARTKPDAIRRLHVDAVEVSAHTMPAGSRAMCRRKPVRAPRLLAKAYEVLADVDATLVEINPFVLLTDGTVMALDAKVTVDDNALFRQPGGGAEDSFDRLIEKRAKDAGCST